MKVLILGGDGFCGWPTSLHLSRRGCDVLIVDNLSRRRIAEELRCDSLTPIASIQERLEAWREVAGLAMRFALLDLAREYGRFLELVREERPDAIVHFAAQRSVPYSMRSPRHRIYTVDNNVNATHNVLCAVVEAGLDCHVVHLGSMGVYGYLTSGLELPEGWVDARFATAPEVLTRIPYPHRPGSIYHMTKAQAAVLFRYYSEHDGVRITDLHQGVVWGTNTHETSLDERLVNRFDYDVDYGTVVNRFLVQAATGQPLTVYGTGGQSRALLHLRDTVRCVELALSNPPERGSPVQVFHQMSEIHRVRDLARLVADRTGASIALTENPRAEAPENEMFARNDKLRSLGLEPTLLSDGLLDEVLGVVRKHAARFVLERTMPERERP